jgi:predicted amidohydrolase
MKKEKGAARKKTWRIAVCQMTVTPDLADNLARILSLIRRAGRRRADFLLFPEYALTGSRARHRQDKIEDALDRIAAACAKAGVAAIVGTVSATRRER